MKETVSSIPVLASSGGFFSVQGEYSMTTYDLRITARQLVELHQRFAPLFGRKEAQAQSLVYLNGLLLANGRKSAEPIALAFGQASDDGINQNQVLALQRFLTYSPWSAQEVQRKSKASSLSG